MKQLIQKRIDVDGGWVTVDIHGDPGLPAMLMIPGVMADAASWAAVACRIEGWPTVAVINRRGRCPSGPIPDGYGLATEVADAEAVARELVDVRALFGWSYGGLIALHLASQRAVPHVIAYEPIMAPFGRKALTGLRRAYEEGDLDRVVEVALRDATGAGDDAIAALRADSDTWAELRRLGAPIYAETAAINRTPQDLPLLAARVDLIVGDRNRGQHPYGTVFTEVARRVPHATTHVLPGQGHLAHREAPDRLADMISALRPAAGDGW